MKKLNQSTLTLLVSTATTDVTLFTGDINLALRVDTPIDDQTLENSKSHFVMKLAA